MHRKLKMVKAAKFTESQRNGEPKILRIRDSDESEETDDPEDTDEYLPFQVSGGNLSRAAQAAFDDKSKCDPLFKYARALKAYGIPESKLAEAFEFWWRNAPGKVDLESQLSKEDYLHLFRDTYPKVKKPLGQSTLEAAMKRARNSRTEAIEAKRYESPNLKALIRLCKALQAAVGDAPFYLSTRDAGRFLGLNHSYCAVFMKVLVRDGVLSLAKQGNSKRAPRYRFNFASQTKRQTTTT